MPLQQELLLIFIKKPGLILSQEEIISRLWPDQKATKTKRPALNLAIHRLRQVFAQGPLGSEVAIGPPWYGPWPTPQPPYHQAKNAGGRRPLGRRDWQSP